MATKMVAKTVVTTNVYLWSSVQQEATRRRALEEQLTAAQTKMIEIAREITRLETLLKK